MFGPCVKTSLPLLSPFLATTNNRIVMASDPGPLAPSTKVTLLTIPTEVRLKILETLFRDIKVNPQPVSARNGGRQGYSTFATVLQTCSLLNREARKVFYHSAVFGFQSHLAVGIFRRRLQSDRQIAQCIQSVESLQGHTSMTPDFAELLQELPNLSTLSLEVPSLSVSWRKTLEEILTAMEALVIDCKGIPEQLGTVRGSLLYCSRYEGEWALRVPSVVTMAKARLRLKLFLDIAHEAAPWCSEDTIVAVSINHTRRAIPD